MDASDTTCWTVIRGASQGSARDRDAFARRYLDPVRAYLTARWRKTIWRDHVDDTVQEVFVECFRAESPLIRADRTRHDGFRPYLYGIVRNVARRVESRVGAEGCGRALDLSNLPGDEATLSRAFDMAWARSILREAAQLQRQRAAEDASAQSRLELLRLRFYEGIPIREIARRWQQEPARVHHQYAQARQEFKGALVEVLRFHHPGCSDRELQQQCAALVDVLG